MQQPRLFRESFVVIEPWEHVGFNPLGEAVQASKNVAYIAQRIADADTVLWPVWKSGVLNPEVVVPLITAGLGVVVEGGDPAVYDPATFSHPACTQEDMLRLIDALVTSRSPTSAPVIFVCLGHQLAAESHRRLLRRAVSEVLHLSDLGHDPAGRALRTLQAVWR